MKRAEDFLQDLGVKPTSSSALLVDDGFAEVQALSKQIESRAVYLLAMREHGAKELKTKLVTKFPETSELLATCKERPGLVKNLVDDVLKKCQEHNWQSDERYIEHAVRNWAAKGNGPIKIRQKLQQASARDDLITMYLDWDESEWLELAKDVLIKKYGDTCKPEARNEQAKRMRFLQSRGFAPHVIWQAFR
ncbi:regulatory protein RecX [Thiomicrorhabdus arctica]|uniref:regulatory protein RecX n=1 Tax=Thiomicrorhabdus arctica TaxID=131540 RepID=UPI0003814696|nr:regulatory protein RecX [Thiomicrorhabdus arctica]